MYKDACALSPVSTCTPLGMYEGSSSEKARLRHNGLAWRFFSIYIDTLSSTAVICTRFAARCNPTSCVTAPTVARVCRVRLSCNLGKVLPPSRSAIPHSAYGKCMRDRHPSVLLLVFFHPLLLNHVIESVAPQSAGSGLHRNQSSKLTCCTRRRLQ